MPYCIWINKLILLIYNNVSINGRTHLKVWYYLKGELEMKCMCKIDNPLETPFGYTISMIGGKWNLIILHQLKRNSVMRYSELKRTLTGITHKMLSQKLKELEANKLIIRKEYPQVPPKVEYSLSERGLSLSKIMQDICEWGHAHSND